MSKISAATYKEIRRMILAGQLFPVAELSLKTLLELGGVELYQSIISRELQEFISKNPEYRKCFCIEGNDAYIQIDLLEKTKDLFLRYIDESIYLMGIKVLQAKNKVPNGFNNEILELKKCKTRDIKAELANILNHYADSQPEAGSAEEKAVSIVQCIFESLIYSRSFLGRIEGFFIKHFSNISMKNIEKEILLST